MRNQIAFAWRGPLPGPDRAAGLMANREPAAIAQLQPVLDRVAAALAAHPGTETPG